MAKTISLTRSQVAVVDDEDYEWLMQWSWCALWSRFTKSFYAARGVTKGGQKLYLMHREILGLERGVRMCADHINHDTLDNRRSNLRIATYSQNRAHSKLRSDSKTGFKGVARTPKGRFMAQIKDSGKNKYLGTFDTPEEAFAVYSLAAKRLHGEFA